MKNGNQQRLWPEETQYGPLEELSPDECETLRALCEVARTGDMQHIVSEMVDDGICESGEEWLMSVLEVRA